MNRKIKFRGIREEYNPAWHQSIFRFGNLLNNNSIGEVGYDLSHYEYAKVKPETIGQFTGLLDKNGNEIYEGDILQWTSSNPFSLGEIRKIQVSYVQAQYWGQGRNLGVYLAELLSNEKCEIVGNIYENGDVF